MTLPVEGPSAVARWGLARPLGDALNDGLPAYGREQHEIRPARATLTHRQSANRPEAVTYGLADEVIGGPAETPESGTPL